jgi:hypothetical protein
LPTVSPWADGVGLSAGVAHQRHMSGKPCRNGSSNPFQVSANQVGCAPKAARKSIRFTRKGPGYINVPCEGIKMEIPDQGVYVSVCLDDISKHGFRLTPHISASRTCGW